MEGKVHATIPVVDGMSLLLTIRPGKQGHLLLGEFAGNLLRPVASLSVFPWPCSARSPPSLFGRGRRNTRANDRGGKPRTDHRQALVRIWFSFRVSARLRVVLVERCASARSYQDTSERGEPAQHEHARSRDLSRIVRACRRRRRHRQPENRWCEQPRLLHHAVFRASGVPTRDCCETANSNADEASGVSLSQHLRGVRTTHRVGERFDLGSCGERPPRLAPRRRSLYRFSSGLRPDPAARSDGGRKKRWACSNSW